MIRYEYSYQMKSCFVAIQFMIISHFWLKLILRVRGNEYSRVINIFHILLYIVQKIKKGSLCKFVWVSVIRWACYVLIGEFSRMAAYASWRHFGFCELNLNTLGCALQHVDFFLLYSAIIVCYLIQPCKVQSRNDFLAAKFSYFQACPIHLSACFRSDDSFACL